ncbi:MAG: hypothetical protein JXB00_18940 [Bacteroidales bacterium]|nr:hypothetical protein [Bacteroidales bacterium]
MPYIKIKENLLQKLDEVQQEKISYEIVYRDDQPCPGENEFLFFIKPEITLHSEQIKYPEIFKMIFDKISGFDFRIHDTRIISASYLDRFDIIAQHYGVINRLSRKPLDYLSEEARNKFMQLYSISAEEANIQGSLEYLEKNTTLDAETLNTMCQNSKIEKLAGGTYVNRLMVDGKDVFIINGFHPKQLKYFTAKGRSIISFRLSSGTSWKTARNNFIGKTNPEDAAKGSIRNELLVNREKFGLETVSSSFNGAHLSAGPVEGLAELIRYNSDYFKGDIKTYKDFSFGLRLSETFSEQSISRMLSNTPVNYQGKTLPVFDLTEEMDSDEALKLLKEVFKSTQ